MKVGNQTDLSIVLYEKQELLDEVVVVGYGTMKKSDLNASIVSVSLRNSIKQLHRTSLKC